jgi:hypothetical protein
MTSAAVVYEGLNVAKTNRKLLCLQFLVGISILAASVGVGIGSSRAQQLAAQTDRQPSQQDSSRKPSMKPAVTLAAAAPDVTLAAADVKAARRSQSGTAAKGPYYVDFRARTAATYGHAFVWFGKTSEKQVEVAGLWPEGDEVPYMLGHLTWVPSGTGASYGDLDEEYLTASYRVYLNEEDAKKVFAYIKHLQATSPLWNAETTNCTFFIGEIASFMGLKAPFHLLMPEEYINQLKAINGGRQTAQLTADH